MITVSEANHEYSIGHACTLNIVYFEYTEANISQLLQDLT